MSRHHEFTQGAGDMLPMLLGAIPFGIIFGSLAGAAGLDPWQTQGMSLLVFAGSAQFIAISLLTGGAGIAVVLLKENDLFSTTAGVGTKIARTAWIFAVAAKATVTRPESTARNRPKPSMWFFSARPSAVKIAATSTTISAIHRTVFIDCVYAFFWTAV